MASLQATDFGKDLGLLHEVLITGRKVGVDRRFWANLAENPDLFRKIFALERYNGYEPTRAHREAREIMEASASYFGIQEAIDTFDISPSRYELSRLAKIPFSPKVLEALRPQGYVLTALFQRELHYLLRGWCNGYNGCPTYSTSVKFGQTPDGWQPVQKRIFEKIEPESRTGWHLVRWSVPNSGGKTLAEQMALLQEGEERVPLRVLAYVQYGCAFGRTDTTYVSPTHSRAKEDVVYDAPIVEQLRYPVYLRWHHTSNIELGFSHEEHKDPHIGLASWYTDRSAPLLNARFG